MPAILKARSLGPSKFIASRFLHQPDRLTQFINYANTADDIAWARHCWIVHNRHGEWRKEFVSKGMIK